MTRHRAVRPLISLLSAAAITSCGAALPGFSPDVAGPGSATAATPTSPSPTQVQAVRGGTAEAALAALPVKGRAPKTGYSRERFGPAWADVDHDGCDQRNQVLARDMTGETTKPGTRGCVVLTGTLADPYTGRSIAFVRGRATSEAVQIDHVVALSDAWQTGAQQLDDPTRRRLAGDPENLQATDGPTNQAKRDADAATWLPPSTGYRCTYVARQVKVKTSYRLWVTPPERDAMARVLARCPGLPLPGAPAPAR